MSKLIRMRFPAKCKACGTVLKPNQSAWWKTGFGTKCQGCGPHTEADPPTKRRGIRRPEEKPETSESSPPPPPPPPPENDPRPYDTDERTDELDERHDNADQRSDDRDHEPDRDVDQTPPSEFQETASELSDAESRRRRARCDADGVHRHEWSSVGEVLWDAFTNYAQNEGNRRNVNYTQFRTLSGKSKFGNYFTRQRLMDQVRNPDPSTVEAIKVMRDELLGSVTPPTSPRRKVRRGLDWGDELDVDRWSVRDPQGWERSVREPTAKRVVTIGVDVTVHHKRLPDELLYRGAAALALADWLTERGYSVEIVGFISVVKPTRAVRRYAFKVRIKDALMPLSIGDLAFSLCEIAFFRHVILCAGSRRVPGALTKGWGGCLGLLLQDREGIDFLIGQHITTRETAVMWLRAHILHTEASHV